MESSSILPWLTWGDSPLTLWLKVAARRWISSYTLVRSLWIAGKSLFVVEKFWPKGFSNDIYLYFGLLLFTVLFSFPVAGSFSHPVRKQYSSLFQFRCLALPQVSTGTAQPLRSMVDVDPQEAPLGGAWYVSHLGNPSDSFQRNTISAYFDTLGDGHCDIVHIDSLNTLLNVHKLSDSRHHSRHGQPSWISQCFLGLQAADLFGER